MHRTILAIAAAGLLASCAPILHEHPAPPNYEPEPTQGTTLQELREFFEGNPKAPPAAHLPLPSDKARAETAFEKVEDEAKRLLDEIEGKPGKE